MAMIPLDYSKAIIFYQQISRSRQADFRNDLIFAAIRYAELRVRSQQPNRRCLKSEEYDVPARRDMTRSAKLFRAELQHGCRSRDAI